MTFIKNIKNNLGNTTLILQIAALLLTFSLLAFSSHTFVKNVERKLMQKQAEDALAITHKHIEADIDRAASMLQGLSLTMRQMVLRGDSLGAVIKYFGDIYKYSNNAEIPGFEQFFGYFEAFGEKTYDHNGVRMDTVNLALRPWYEAVATKGRDVAFTSPYASRVTGKTIITASRRIFDDDGKPIGILAMNMNLNAIHKHTEMLNEVFNGSYGIIKDGNSNIISYPNRDFIGKNISVLGGKGSLDGDSARSGEYSERLYVGEDGKRLIAFSKTIANCGWHIGLFIPEESYMTSMRNLTWFFLVLNSLLIAIVCYMLAHLSRAQRANNEFMDLITNSIPLSCDLWDSDHNLITSNDMVKTIFGVQSKQEYINRFYDFSPEYQPDGRLSRDVSREVLNKAFAEGYAHFEWMHQTVNGHPLPSEVTLVRVNFKGKPAVMAYIRDMRETQAMMREAHRAEIAEASSRAKSRFLATMSHEIRTPMNVILGLTDIQLQDDALAPHLRETFTQIYNSGELLMGIINDILDLSKIEADKMEFVPVEYQLASLVYDTAHNNMMHNSKPIEFELSVDENAPAYLYGDELRIKQILNNLLSNAFKFTERGGIRLCIKVEEAPRDALGNNVELVVSVSDTGQGMSKEQLDRLFSEYTRFNLEHNRFIEGTGLGMNITSRLVSMMGGKIDVCSEVGKGTTVTVRLPQKRVNGGVIGKELAESLSTFRAATTENAKKAQFTRDYMPYGRVLVVDDIESNLYVARGLMASYGLSIDTASSGQQAIEKVMGGKLYDIIFMDHMMPVMNGVDATIAIRQLGYTMPIVALTANAVIGQASIFLRNGFDDFISKPIDVRQLNAILNRLIRDKQPPEILERARQLKTRVAAKNLPFVDGAAMSDPGLFAVFAKDAARTIPTLKRVAGNAFSASEDDINLFTINVHAIKSALANIGETRLSQVAATLEKAGRALDRNTINLQSHSFIKALQSLIKKAEAASSKKQTAEFDEEPETLKKRLELMAKACEDYDERTIDEALAAIKKMKLTKETADNIEKIGDLILHSEFEEAGETARNAIGQVRGG